MGAVLTTDSSVCCKHLGIVQTSSTSPLRVKGAAVLVQEGIQGKDIAGCTTPPTPPNKPPNKKCSKVSGITGGSAQKLKVNGQPVMLQTLAGMTDGLVEGVPQELAEAQAVQMILQAI